MHSHFSHKKYINASSRKRSFYGEREFARNMFVFDNKLGKFLGEKHTASVSKYMKGKRKKKKKLRHIIFLTGHLY